MRYQFRIHPEASLEFYESIEWYDAQQPNLGFRFEQIILSMLDEIALRPEIHSFIKGRFRQAVVPVFPFVIVYKVATKGGYIFVSSFFHTSRNPKKKFRREQ